MVWWIEDIHIKIIYGFNEKTEVFRKKKKNTKKAKRKEMAYVLDEIMSAFGFCIFLIAYLYSIYQKI